MTFTAIVTSHANERGLRSILGNLIYQTRKPDEIVVLCSDTPGLLRLREDFPEVSFHERPNREDWGHEKRAEGVLLAGEDWLGFFNDDDAYALDYLEKMLAPAELADAIYCGWNAQPNCYFMLGSSTSGNFIVRSSFAKRIGYESRRYEADGDFIDALVRNGARVERVDEVLYTHN